MFARIRHSIGSVKERGRADVGHARIRYPWLDHLIRTVQRYQVVSGDRLAGACTYFGFLSLFPLIALAFGVFGYVLALRPDVLEALNRATNEALQQHLPGLADQLRLDDLAQARLPAGAIGLLGLLYAGLGSVNALRDALHEIWMTGEPPLPFLRAKLRDFVALILVGITLVLSMIVSGFATGATTTVSEWLGMGGSPLAAGSVWAVGLLASLVADMLVFLIIMRWLASPSEPYRVILQGALLGAVGLGLLKQLATLILAGTLASPVYGTFAVIAGLLIWLNLSARVILYAAAWTATATLGPPPGPTPVPSNGVH
jgi:membrane protein